MSKTKSLQYLLLDTINKRKNKRNSQYVSNLTKTLRVNETNSYYDVSWVENFKKSKIEIEKNKFNFYIRNDLDEQKPNTENLLEKNNKSASEVIDRILNEKEIVIKPINLLKKYIFHIFFFLISFFPLIILSSSGNKLIGISIILLFFLDFLKDTKKILFHLYFVIISIIQPNEFIFYYAIFCLFFTFFEPGIYYKKIKILLIALAIILNFYFLNNESLIIIDKHLLIIVFLTILITLNNFTLYNSNFNWIYCMPAFTFVFLNNENVLIAYISILICFITPYFFNYLDKKFFLKINTSPILE